MNEMKHNSLDFDPTNSLKRCNSTPTINHILPAVNRSPAPIVGTATTSTMNSTSNLNITSTTSRSRDASPTPPINIFAPKARRYSTGFSPLATNPGPLPRLTPRVSQLRQEECADMNSREVNHEREVHTAMQISQSWEDLTLDAENWSFKSDTSSDLTHPLHVTLPTGIISCSSPSPTSSRAGLRLPPYGLSPSPTRRTFQTRRSMSPIAMRPSSLGPVKRKFELDDYSNSYSPPPFKKMFTDSSRGQSPCRSPLLQTCPSPDSNEGRTTPKFYISKLCTTNTNSSSSQSSSLSAAPSPSSSSAMEIPMDIPSSLCTNSITKTDLINNVGLAVPSNGNHSVHSGAHSDLNSDCSDVDFDSDSQLKTATQDADDKLRRKHETVTCAKLKKLFFTRVSTDSTETDCSVEFKTQTSCEINTNLMNERVNDAIIADNKSWMDCDSTKKEEKLFDGLDSHAAVIVDNLVTSMDNVEVSKPAAVDMLKIPSIDPIATTDCTPVSTTATDETIEPHSTENP